MLTQESLSWSCASSNVTLSSLPKVPTESAALTSIGGKLDALLDIKNLVNSYKKIFIIISV